MTARTGTNVHIVVLTILALNTVTKLTGADTELLWWMYLVTVVFCSGAIGWLLSRRFGPTTPT